MKNVIIDGKEYIENNGIYTPVVKESPYEEMGGTYKVEMIDGEYLVMLPNIEEEEIPLDMSEVNHWGKMRLQFLEDQKPDFLNRLASNNKILPHLLQIQEEAWNFEEEMLPKMKKEAGLTEDMKNSDMLGYVAEVNNILAQIRDMIIKKIIEQ